jgi:hypothetical protein
MVMFQFYQGLVQFKIDCGIFIYSSTLKSELSILDLVHKTKILLTTVLLYQLSGEIVCKTWRSSKNGVSWDVMSCGSCKNRRF